MRTKWITTAVPLVFLAVACGKGRNQDAALSDDLQKDLELATSPGLDLASAGRQGTQVVSAEEQIPRGTKQPSQKAKTPQRKAPRQPKAPVAIAHHEAKAAPAPVESAPVEAQATPQEVATAPTPAPAPTPGPVVIPSPSGSSSPSDGSIGRGRGTGEGVGTVIGTVLGVVIRGAVVGDDDHCDPRAGRGTIPITIGGRYPRGSGIPVNIPVIPYNGRIRIR